MLDGEVKEEVEERHLKAFQMAEIKWTEREAGKGAEASKTGESFDLPF